MASFEPINPRIGQPADQNNFVLRIQMYISGDVQLHKNIMLWKIIIIIDGPSDTAQSVLL